MNRGNLIAAGVYGIFSVWIIVRSLYMPLTAVDGLGYGFYPLLIGIMMLLLSIWWLVSSLKDKDDGEKYFSINREGILRLAVLVGIIFLIIILMIYFGYFISLSVFYFLIVFLVEKKRGKDAFISISFFALIIVTVYMIFGVWIGVSLPPGIFSDS